MNIRDKLKVMEEVKAANRQHVEDWKKEQEAQGMGKQITGVLVDVVKRTIKPETINQSLDGYYTVLNCRCIDIVTRRIGGKPFLVICDDEGLLVDRPKISAIDPPGEAMFCGNLFIVQTDGADDIMSLSEAEVAHVLKNTMDVRTGSYPEPYPVICNCTY